jgi:hypothetical protein
VNITLRLGEMADSAFLQDAGMTLKGNKLEGVTRLTALGDGMRRVVATLTINTAVAFGEAVKRLILSKPGVGMATVAAWLVQPGIRVLLYDFHAAVTVDAGQAKLLGHDIA